MGLRITNQDVVLRQIQGSPTRISDATRKLASGVQVSRAADDSAGLAVAEALRGDVMSAQAENANLQNAFSLARTAEGGLGQIADGLQRLRELAVQASSGIVPGQDRVGLNAEAGRVLDQTNRTAQETEFNGINPLNGSVSTLEVGAANGLVIEFQPATPEALGIATLNLTTVEGAASALGQIDAALNSINQNRTGIAAITDALGSAMTAREVAGENLMAARARIADANVALEITNLVQGQILRQGGAAAVAQGNIVPRAVTNLLS